MDQHIFSCSRNSSSFWGSSRSNFRMKCHTCSFDHVFQSQFYFNWKEKILKEVKSQLKSKEVEQLENEISESLDANLKVNFNYLDLDCEVMKGVIHLLFTVSKQDVQVNHYLTLEVCSQLHWCKGTKSSCRGPAYPCFQKWLKKKKICSCVLIKNKK